MTKNADNTVKFQYTTNKTDPLNEEQLAEQIKLPNSNKKVNETTLNEMKKRVGEIKLKEKKRDLTVHKEENTPLPLNEDQIKASRIKLDNLDKQDKTREATIERRDFLERFLFDKKEWLDSTDAKTVKLNFKKILVL